MLSPCARHGISLACMRSSDGSHVGVLVGLQLEDVGAGEREHGVHASDSRAMASSRTRDRIGVRVERLEARQRARRAAEVVEARAASLPARSCA